MKKNNVTPKKPVNKSKDPTIRKAQLIPTNPWEFIDNQSGRIGYLIAWMLGVPVSLLFLIFIIRGH